MKKIPLFNCLVDDDAISKARDIMMQGNLAAGSYISSLEVEFEKLLLRPSVSVSDITHGIQLALIMAGVKHGDEVLVLSYNCLASTTAILAVGAIPVWIDLSIDSFQMSILDCESVLTSKTKVVLLYHVAGYPADVDKYVEFCKKYNLVLIEDVNNSLGAMFDGKPLGTFGDFSVFSFYANRQINGVQGGMVVCPNETVKDEVKRLRYFGIDTPYFRNSEGEISQLADVPRIGISASMNNLNACIALEHFHLLEARIKIVRDNVNYFYNQLSDICGVTPMKWIERATPSFWVFFIKCHSRDLLMSYLKKNGIECGKLHHPNHYYSGFSKTTRILPNTEIVMQEILALPCGWWLTTSQIKFILSNIFNFFKLGVKII